jgi:hypothetical protein
MGRYTIKGSSTAVLEGKGDDTRTWLFGEGRIDPNVVEMNLRRGQLKTKKRITR